MKQKISPEPILFHSNMAIHVHVCTNCYTVFVHFVGRVQLVLHSRMVYFVLRKVLCPSKKANENIENFN